MPPVACGFARGLPCLGLVLSCGAIKSDTFVADNKDVAKKPAPAIDLRAQEKELADLERQIAVKEKELADLSAKAGILRVKIAQAKGSDIPLLSDLLAKLPKDRWPKDEEDSLKWLQAEEWFKHNVAGKQATWTFVYKEVSFRAGKDGKYNARVHFFRVEAVRSRMVLDVDWARRWRGRRWHAESCSARKAQ
jgi:hypothetical protein